MLSGISDRHNEFKGDKMIFPNLSVMYGERVCTVRYEIVDPFVLRLRPQGQISDVGVAR